MNSIKHRTQISLEDWQYHMLLETVKEDKKEPLKYHQGFIGRKIQQTAR